MDEASKRETTTSSLTRVAGDRSQSEHTQMRVTMPAELFRDRERDSGANWSRVIVT